MNGAPPTKASAPDRIILAVETSCDETAVAIIRGRNQLLASEVASQIDLHRLYGGVVPEAASRQHLREIDPLIKHALNTAGVRIEEVDAFAATNGPGLASSLMIGSAIAKGLALGCGKPFLAINHLEGHLLSPFFAHPAGVQPSIGLVVSGGHTLLVAVASFGCYRRLGGTLDDAAGEAFDKVAKLLGLPYPGGPEVDREARAGNPSTYELPRSMLGSGNYNFSFSGIKTAVRYLLPKIAAESERRLSPEQLCNLCASFQEAVVDVLVRKTLDAAVEYGMPLITVSGGVSMNARLRERFASECTQRGRKLLLASPALCTDNAVMIAAVAALALASGEISPLSEDINPNLTLNFLAAA